MTGGVWLACGGIAVAGACVQGLREHLAKGRPPAPPREPATDFSPFVKGLVTGAPQACYTARVGRVVTPPGDVVNGGRCCRRGHTSPRQALAHAERIRDRIERTGR